MKRSTLIRLSFLTLIMAAGTFWWGFHFGRGLALAETSDKHEESVVEPIRLLGGSDRSNQKADGSDAKASGVAPPIDGENERTLDEVIAEAMALPLDGLVSPRRMAMASDVMKQVDDRDLAAALKLLDTQERGQAKQFLRMILLSRWAKIDGLGAANYVLENPGEHPQGMGWGHTGMEELKDVISNWVESDPTAALEWYQRESDRLIENNFDVNDGTCLTTIFGALSAQNVDEAFAKLETLEGDRNRMFAMTGMLNASNTQQRGELIGAVDAIEEPFSRSDAYQMLMSEWARLDPKEAAAYVDNDSHLDSKTEEILMSAVGTVWMADYPEEGANWLAENATEENRSSRMVHAVRTWTRQDPNEAAKWLANFEPSPQLDNVFSIFAIETMHQNMKGSFEWAAKITEDNKRNRAFELIFQRWHIQNPEEAEAHLRMSNVPPDQLAEWIEQSVNRQLGTTEP